MQIANTAPLPATVCPQAWLCKDVGFGMLPGTQIYTAGNWVLQGAGADIGQTQDQFHGVWQTLSNNGSVSARVTSIQKLDSYSKAGVMLREGMDPGSPYYAILATANSGLIVSYRDKQEGYTTLHDIPLVKQLPIYLKVTRAGNVFNAYYSQDGVHWIVVPGATATVNMPASLFAGLAMTSHASLLLGTATFDTVRIG